MPNYVSHIVTVKGDAEKVKELFKLVKSKESCFDFNRIVPMPKELHIDSSTDGDDGMLYLVAKNKNIFSRTEDDKTLIQRIESSDRMDRIVELGKKYLSNIAKYGHKDWYDWSLEKWGTKWNTCEPSTNGTDSFYFDTAWSTCYPVIEALSNKVPDVEIDVVFADEDTGCNTGHYGFKNGIEIYSEFPNDGSDDAFEYYFQTHEDMRDYYEKNENGDWRYKDED